MNFHLRKFSNDICIGVFNVKVTYNAISKSKNRFSFFNKDVLIEKKVRKELSEIDDFYNCVDEYFQTKLNEYIK